MTDREFNRARGSLAAHARWAKDPDRVGATAKMRAGFIDKLRREARERLGPGATDDQVTKAADSALQAHYARMRLNSLRSRRRAAAAAQAARDAIADAVLAEQAEAAADGT